jgi:hypothetical protein
MESKLSLFILLSFFAFSANADEVILENGTVYSYVVEGTPIDSVTFEYDQYTNPKKPVIVGKCMLVRDGFSGGDEGRFVTFKRVIVSCPSQRHEFTEPDQTNDFGGFVGNSTNGDWGVSMGFMDGVIQNIRIISSERVSRLDFSGQFIVHDRLNYDATEDCFLVKGRAFIENSWKESTISVCSEGTVKVQQS